MSTNNLTLLREGLFASGLVHPLDGQSKAARVTVFCRIVPGQDKSWMRLAEELLLLEKNSSSGFELNISRRYKLNAENKIAFGWEVTVSHKTAKALTDSIVTAILPVLKLSALRIEQTVVEERVRAEAPKPPLYPAVPNASAPKLRVVQSDKDTMVVEMPLPHYGGSDMNKPNSKGRGATTLGGATQSRRR